MLSVSVDSPTNHEVTAEQGFGGVVLVRYVQDGVPMPELGNVPTHVSGVLLSTGRHVLTARHNIPSELEVANGRSLRIEVDLNGDNVLDSSDQFIPVAATTRHPTDDLAILELAFEVDDSIPRYDIYREFDEFGQVGVRVGYGVAGQGFVDPNIFLPTKKRFGVNRYDNSFDEFRLRYDFDGNGINTFGDAGEGNAEVLSASRDSGSPVFLNGRIAGIAVTGAAVPYLPVYGGIGTDVRVSKKADWIDSILPPQIANVTISGSTSTHTPHSFNNPLDDINDFDGSGIQLRTVPVGNADTVTIQFSEHVSNLQASHLVLRGLRSGAVPALVTGTDGFSYSPVTHQATWRFNTPFAANQYVLSLSDLVTDEAFNRLDGEWTNPFRLETNNTLVSEFPSGNGLAGGNFNFVFSMLPGDATLNNLVNTFDYTIWYTNYYGDPPLNAVFTQGDMDGSGEVDYGEDYFVYANFLRDFTQLVSADFNGDGLVNGLDLAIWQAGYEDDSAGDADGDGDVDGVDYLIWQRQSGLELTWVA